MRKVLSVAAWRLRRTVTREWGGYLSIVLLIGLLGGIAMGAVAGARRTEASYPTYLASTNPSDVSIFTNFGPISHSGYTPKIEAAIARLPYVEHAITTIGFDGTLKLPPSKVPGEAPPAFEGSPNGEYTAFDRVALVSGRLANPDRPDEFVMSAAGAANYGLYVGSTLRLASYRLSDLLSPTINAKPDRFLTLRLVGIVESSFQVVQSDDAALGSQFAVFTPALTRQLALCCAYYSYTSLKLVGGTDHLAQVAAAVHRLVPGLGPAGGERTNAGFVAEAEGAIRPEAIAYGIFGLLAALAALLVCLQLIGRATRRSVGNARVLRALGADRTMTTVDLSFGVIGAILCGTLLAVVVAVCLSPLAPIGPVRPVYPDVGFAFDWFVLGVGAALLITVLVGAAIVMAVRAAPRQGDAGRRARSSRGSSVARAAASMGMAPSAVTGIRSSLDPGSSDDPAPVRAAAFGAVLALIVLTASVTFGASLNALVSKPSLYGWNWNYALLSGFSGAEDLPGHELATLLNRDPYVERWAAVSFSQAMLDHRFVPTLAETPGASVYPTQLTGHSLARPSEIVLAPATLAQLHKRIGDTVLASTGGRGSATLRIVGTATMPTIGGSGNPDLQMGTGAVIASSLYPAGYLNEQHSTVPGPNAAFIVIKGGVRPSVALASLDRINQILSQSADGPVGGVVPVLRPAQIADYRTIGTTPSLLAGVLALGAIGALGLTLAASVQRRRRELALLKTFGFTRWQLATSVAWQATVPAVIGIVAGIPLGIVLGRWIWTLFAQGIYVVPVPTVPIASVVIIGLGALVFANLAAAIPSRLAAGTRTSAVLRAE